MFEPLMVDPACPYCKGLGTLASGLRSEVGPRGYGKVDTVEGRLLCTCVQPRGRPIRTYLVLLWNWRQSMPVSYRIRAYDAVDAKTQAELLMQKYLTMRDDKWVSEYLLKGIEPYEEGRHGTPEWFT